MYKGKTISVVLPCYNEAEGLSELGPAIPSWVDEWIVVDNRSTDETAKIAARCGAKIVHENIRGYGRAIKTGLAEARGEIIAILDGDHSYPVEEIQKLLETMLSGKKDFVSGCRYPLVEKNAQPRLNILCNFLMTVLVGILFQKNIRDSQSGMMLFTREAADQLKTKDQGMGFSQEMKLRAWEAPNLQCSESPITYRPRKGKVKFRKVKDSLQNLSSLFALWGEYRGVKTLALAFGILGILLRLKQYSLNRSLWLDEAKLAANLLQKSFAGLWQALDMGQFATIGFMEFEKLVMTLLGPSEFSLRLFPLLCGITAVIVFYKLAKRTLHPASLLPAIAYFSFSPTLIAYSAEVKEYSCDVLMSILFCFGTLSLCAVPLTKRRILSCGVIGLVSMWFLVKASFMLEAFALSMTVIYLLRNQKLIALKWLPVYGVWAASFFIFHKTFSGHYSQEYIESCLNDFRAGLMIFPPHDLKDIRHYLQVFSDAIRFLTGSPAAHLLHFLFWVGCFRVWRENKEKFAVLFSPIVCVALASFLWRYPFSRRLILFLAPFFILFIAEGMTMVLGRALRFSRKLGIACIVLSALTLPCLYPGYLQESKGEIPFEDNRPVIRYVLEHRKEGDFFYAYPNPAAFKYYAAGMPFSGKVFAIGRPSRKLKEAEKSYRKTLDSLHGKARAWIILSHILPDHQQFILSYLDQRGHQLDSIRRTGTSAFLYAFSSGEDPGGAITGTPSDPL